MRNHEPYNDIEVKSKPKSKKWIKAAAAAALIAAAVCCWYAAPRMGAGAKGGNAAAEAPSVTVAVVKSADISARPSEYVGRAEAIQSVQVKPQISGEIARVYFQEGSMVREGQPLFQIDPARYQATVELRRAELEKAGASLAEADKYYRRVTAADSRAVSAAERDNAEANLLQCRAALSQAKAGLRLAEIDLGYCRITSPITGKIGAAIFTKGNYVTPASGPLASIVQMDPIRVSYTLPDRDYLDQLEYFKSQGAVYKTKLVLSNGTTFGAAGSRDFEDNIVDRQTGTVLMHLRYKNGDGRLIPGEMVRVFTQPVKSRMVPVIPQAAVMADAKGDFVYVVEADDTVRDIRVKLGREFGMQREVDAGLSEGQRVVVAGLQNIRPGVKVKINAPAPSGKASDSAGDGRKKED